MDYQLQRLLPGYQGGLERLLPAPHGRNDGLDKARPTPGVLRFHIDPSAGDDAASGESAAEPVASLDRAKELYEAVRYDLSDGRRLTFEISLAKPTGATWVLTWPVGWRAPRQLEFVCGAELELLGNDGAPLGELPVASDVGSASWDGGLVLTTSQPMGWQDHMDLRDGGFVRLATESFGSGDVRVVGEATGSSSLRYFGRRSQQDFPLITKGASGSAVRLVRPAVQIVLPTDDPQQGPVEGIGPSQLTFEGLELTGDTPDGALLIANGSLVLRQCLVKLPVWLESSRLILERCHLSSTADLVASDNSVLGLEGSALDAPGASLLLVSASVLRIGGFCGLLDHAALLLADQSRIMAVNQATIHLSDSAGPRKLEQAAASAGISIDRVRWLGKLPSGQVRLLETAGPAEILWHPETDVVQADGATQATVSMNGGGSETTADVLEGGFVRGHPSFATDYQASLQAILGP